MGRAGITLLALSVLLGGCEKLARNMYDQQRYKPMHESSLFADGTSARSPVPGTIAAASGTAAGTAIEIDRAKAAAAKTMPYPVTLQLLHRGQERFDIYCAPCHSAVGDGDGMVARRGFPHPPTYHSDRLRKQPDRYFYDVITNGYGVMRPYADRVAPEDRWAIVAYIRALQLSQYAEMSASK